MTPIAQDPTRALQRLPARLLEATVLDPPTDADGWLRVEIASQPGAAVSVPWEPRVDLNVMPGDAAVVQESDEGNFWCVQWWSQSGLTPTPPGGTVGPATTSALGIVQMSAAPADAAHPIAVGDNDPRNTNARTPTAHVHPESDVAGLSTDLAARVQVGGDLGGTPMAPTVPGLAAKENTANKGAVDGYAPLDSGLLVPVANLPKLNAIGAPVADVSLNNHKLTNVLDPTAAQDAATKNYIDTTGVASVNIEGWHQISAPGEPGFQNGWANYGTGFPTAAYKKYPDGRVRLRGLIRSGTATTGTVLFTLPVGYRPVDTTTQLIFPAASVEAFGEVRVASGGEVAIFTGSNTWLSLDGIEFDSGQTLWPSGGSLGPGAIGARVSKSAGQSPSSNAPLAFDTEEFDSDNMANLGTANDRLTIATAGNYVVEGGVLCNAVTESKLVIKVNGTTERAYESNPATGADPRMGVAAVIQLAADDYVQLIVQHGGVTFSGVHLAATRIPGAQGAGLGVTSALPTSPVDGQECYFLADATNGIVWHLKWRAASASIYKWEFIGGADLFAEVTAVEQSSAMVGAYADVTTVGPSITVPLAGDFGVEIGFTNNSGNYSMALSMSYAIGATAASDADSCVTGQPQPADTTHPYGAASVARIRRKTFVAAATALVAKYKTTGAAFPAGVGQRFMRVRPVRVG